MEKSWSSKQRDFIETPQRVKAFFEEIEKVCQKHGLSISHEDGHGSFIINEFDKDDIEWLKGANLSME